MARLVIGRVGDPGLTPDLLDAMFRLRHDVFKTRLHWNVSAVGGREKDRFDDLDPVYAISCTDDGALMGCLRLLPTTAPYMLADVFPQALRGEPAPRSPAVWEMSRLASVTAVARSGPQAQVPLGLTASLLITGSADYAVRHGVRELCAFTTPAVERIGRTLGFRPVRFGDGSTLRCGRVESVAVRVPIGHDQRARDPLTLRIGGR
ncbi:acyl-homoserine-lactone synthase [Nocardiopsis mangrovi]|uniref:acyl-homoserine-lactone synthase n=1 Tax=Nocardiopsis mangrovi TaxID=1179818 RepID=A0ABV9E696_9ACTN